MKKAIVMPCGARRSVCAVSLYAISVLDELEGVDVFLADTEDETLWEDEGCQGALEMINARTRLHYFRTVRKSAAQNRTELYRDALAVLGDEVAMLTLDDDTVIPQNMLTEADANFESLDGGDWGYIAHFPLDVLNPNREKNAMHGRRKPSDNGNAWMAREYFSERLLTSYSAPGMAIWFRSGALRPLMGEILEMCAYMTCAEDGLTCTMVSNDHPCFVSKSAWVRHYSTRKHSRDYKDTSRLEQAACFAELSRRGRMNGKGREFWLGEMKKCGHTTNGVGFQK